MNASNFLKPLEKWMRFARSFFKGFFHKNRTFSTSFVFVFLFSVLLLHLASTPPLPSPERPLLFYSNQTRQDIKQLFSQALKKAHHSIFLSIYGITDANILEILDQKSLENILVEVEFDPTASIALSQRLKTAHLFPIRSKGLMHRKIAIVDEAQVYLGSANLTPSSLRHHDNLIVGLYHPPLAHFLRHPNGKPFPFSIGASQATLYLLPDPEELGLQHLLQTLNTATRSIQIAMFTLTHCAIKDALIAAKNRGVDVRIAIDYFTAKGASQKTIEALAKAGIPIFLSQGRELLHHKWAWIDGSLLAMGSANWTKSAFTKNQDFLLFLSLPEKKQRNFLNNLWNIIETECNKKDLRT